MEQGRARTMLFYPFGDKYGLFARILSGFGIGSLGPEMCIRDIIIISRVPILKVLTIASLKTIKKIILYLVILIINGDISVSIHCRRNVFGAIVEKKNSPFI